MSSKNAKNITTKKDDFIEDDGDKRIITFAVIAIVIVIGIVIALLVGCEDKQEKENKKPGNNNPQTDIVVPNKDEDENDSKEEIKTSTITKTSIKTSSNDKEEEKEDEEEIEKFKVTYVYNIVYDEVDGLLDYETDSTKVKKGEKVPTTTWCPLGYTNCEYYTNFEKGVFSNLFDKNTLVTEDITIYIKGEEVEYTIEYKEESLDNPGTFTDANISSTQPRTFKSSDVSTPLENPLSVNGTIFKGWYLYYNDGKYYVPVNELTIDVISFAQENVITLYAVSALEVNINYHDPDGEKLHTQSVRDSEVELISEEDDINFCDNSELLGWSKNMNNVIDYQKGQTIITVKDLDLYAVCGNKKIKYNSDENGDETPDTPVVEKGYDDTNFELPTEEEIIDELGFEVPTYYVPVTTPTETSKVVVDKDITEEIVFENEVLLEDVTNKAGTNYIPQIGDNVEEKEKIFDGWKKQDGNPDTTEETLDETYIPTDGDTLTATWKEQEETVESETPTQNDTNDQNSKDAELNILLDSSPSEQPEFQILGDINSSEVNISNIEA